VENPVDKRQRLTEEPFDYQVTKDQKVLIYWRGKQIKILSGSEAEKFLAAIEGLDEVGIQLALAKVTGNFKRGNERRAKSHNS